MKAQMLWLHDSSGLVREMAPAWYWGRSQMGRLRGDKGLRSSSVPHPKALLEVRVHEATWVPSLMGLCAGYERGEWRVEQLARHIIEWLPDFALPLRESESVRSENAVALLRRAAQAVYTTEKYAKRGEFGELLLHIAIRQEFDTIPAVCKLYYKTATNDTVKGFDAVHVVPDGDDLELWIGEAKLQESPKAAIASVVEELKAHTATPYLRREFILISNKIDPAWPHATRLRELLDEKTSLDKVFRRACIPVMLAYNSEVVASHSKVSKEYLTAFREEIEELYRDFAGRSLPPEVRIHLFLLPLGSKKDLLEALNSLLKGLQ